MAKAISLWHLVLYLSSVFCMQAREQTLVKCLNVAPSHKIQTLLSHEHPLAGRWKCFFSTQIREKPNGNDWQGCCGSALMGPGNWSVSVKLESARPPPQTARHVNVDRPLGWVHYGLSRADSSHQKKSHQCIRRYSLGTDKLILSSLFFLCDWNLRWSRRQAAIQYLRLSSLSGKIFSRRMKIVYSNTFVFSKSLISTHIFLKWEPTKENIACFTQFHCLISVKCLFWTCPICCLIWIYE